MFQLILVGIFVALFYYYGIKPMSYWKSRGVLQGKPMWLLGDKWRHLFRLETIAETIQKAYDLDPNARYIGFYEYNNPALVIRDPDLMKQITIRDFEHFVDHMLVIPEGADPLWSNNLLALRGQTWKEIRGILSHSFTSSKIKMMYSYMSECSENLVEHFLRKDEDLINVTMKDVASRFANDIIASTVFGVQVDSFKNPNNEFYLNGKMFADFTSIRKNMKLFGFLAMPKLLKMLNIHISDPIPRKFFIDLVDNAIKVRKEQNIVRPDMIHLLLEAMTGAESNEEHGEADKGIPNNTLSGQRKRISHKITNEEIAAHAMIFFFGGFDSVSSTMCFMAYELATHPEIQDRLRIEIDEGFKKCNGKITYDVLINMKYLDMVVSETLRKWPNFPHTDRMCTEDYVIKPINPSEKAVIIEKGTLLLLPIFPLHYDEKYFTNPVSFDPERFNDENKIESFTFGLGPRHCIGSRFALIEIKVFFAHLLYRFEIVPTSKTQIPIKMSRGTFNIQPEGGLYLGLKRLNK